MERFKTRRDLYDYMVDRLGMWLPNCESQILFFYLLLSQINSVVLPFYKAFSRAMPLLWMQRKFQRSSWKFLIGPSTLLPPYSPKGSSPLLKSSNTFQRMIQRNLTGDSSGVSLVSSRPQSPRLTTKKPTIVRLSLGSPRLETKGSRLTKTGLRNCFVMKLRPQSKFGSILLSNFQI